MISAAQVVALLEELAAYALWVDGGWGVDALLGEQTREHDDLDLVIVWNDLDAVVDLLGARGFAVERDLLPTAYALRHPDGRGVDLHPVDPTPDGGGNQALEDGGRFHYDAPVTGMIGGHAVRCLSAETQLATHVGYAPDADDRADVHALVSRFGLAPPPGY